MILLALKKIPSILSADLSQVWPEANQHFSKEIDDEANSYFQRIYNHPPHPTMSVDEVCSYIKNLFSARNILIRMRYALMTGLNLFYSPYSQ